MSEQKPGGQSGQGTAPKPDKRPDAERPKPHGDALQHAVDEAKKGAGDRR